MTALYISDSCFSISKYLGLKEKKKKQTHKKPSPTYKRNPLKPGEQNEYSKVRIFCLLD